MKRREHRIWANDNPTLRLNENMEEPQSGSRRPQVEGLALLRQFCGTGVDFYDTKADTFAKELLYYRVLDMFAQVHEKGKDNDVVVARSNIPYLHYLVGTLLFSRTT